MPDEHVSGSNDALKSRAPRSRSGRRPRYTGKPQYFGAVDLGTNNCRLLIARSMQNGFQVVDSYSNVVRLGAGLARTGKLAEANMAAAIKAIQVCADKMKAKRVKRWRCIATQACREASNGEAFMQRVKEETGLSFETITPRVEARLSVMGCMNILDLDKEVALVIDIGGGSTELSWVDIRKINTDKMSRRISRPPISAWTSLPVGVVNLSEMYPEDPDDLGGWFEDMKECVREKIRENDCENRFANSFREGRGHLVGTSGTITSLTGVHLKLPFYQRNKIDGIWVDSKHIIGTAKRLSTMSLEDRQKEPCIGTDRATMLVAGCAILDVIYDLWPSDRIRVADRGLREGMLMGLMNKSQIRPKHQNGKGAGHSHG
ncbi:MAG: Ppx/GppA family phosphatase [Acidimicrobiales bacterium]|nr:Ppx/GppA family phosphatase [Hyphomonadaceae bacterium]RZV42472.1 MAG: Ppx/GppA family phosphatase [Acidimicrobiales bacterium]